MALHERLDVDPADQRALRDAFGRFATGVTIVTAEAADGPVAITANSFSSVSLEPPLVLWSIARTSRRFGYFADAEHYAIHVLSRQQADLCRSVARDVHALRDFPLERSDRAVPLIEGSLARFECCKVAGYTAGDHVIVLGRVLRTDIGGGEPLTFFGGRFGQIAGG